MPILTCGDHHTFTAVFSLQSYLHLHLFALGHWHLQWTLHEFNMTSMSCYWLPVSFHHWLKTPEAHSATWFSAYSLCFYLTRLSAESQNKSTDLTVIITGHRNGDEIIFTEFSDYRVNHKLGGDILPKLPKINKTSGSTRNKIIYYKLVRQLYDNHHCTLHKIVGASISVLEIHQKIPHNICTSQNHHEAVYLSTLYQVFIFTASLAGGSQQQR